MPTFDQSFRVHFDLLTCLFFAAAGQWELTYFGFTPDSPRLRPCAFRADPSAISPSIVLALCVPNGHALAAQFRLLLFANPLPRSHGSDRVADKFRRLVLEPSEISVQGA